MTNDPHQPVGAVDFPFQKHFTRNSVALDCYMAILTERQIEIAAREYCRLKGLDPDKNVTHGPDPDGSGITCDVLLYSKRWERVARMMQEQNIMDEAIQHASSM